MKPLPNWIKKFAKLTKAYSFGLVTGIPFELFSDKDKSAVMAVAGEFLATELNFEKIVTTFKKAMDPESYRKTTSRRASVENADLDLVPQHKPTPEETKVLYDAQAEEKRLRTQIEEQLTKVKEKGKALHKTLDAMAKTILAALQGLNPTCRLTQAQIKIGVLAAYKTLKPSDSRFLQTLQDRLEELYPEDLQNEPNYNPSLVFATPKLMPHMEKLQKETQELKEQQNDLLTLVTKYRQLFANNQIIKIYHDLILDSSKTKGLQPPHMRIGT